MSGERHMNVCYILPNGDRYDGECKLSALGGLMRSGIGKLTSASGLVYTGEWHEDKMNGRGTVQYPSGNMFEGELRDNMYHGTGTYTFSDGSKYTGHFHGNKVTGVGTYTTTQGVVWIAEQDLISDDTITHQD